MSSSSSTPSKYIVDTVAVNELSPYVTGVSAGLAMMKSLLPVSAALTFPLYASVAAAGGLGFVTAKMWGGHLAKNIHELAEQIKSDNYAFARIGLQEEESRLQEIYDDLKQDSKASPTSAFAALKRKISEPTPEDFVIFKNSKPSDYVTSKEKSLRFKINAGLLGGALLVGAGVWIAPVAVPFLGAVAAAVIGAGLIGTGISFTTPSYFARESLKVLKERLSHESFTREEKEPNYQEAVRSYQNIQKLRTDIKDLLVQRNHLEPLRPPSPASPSSETDSSKRYTV